MDRTKKLLLTLLPPAVLGNKGPYVGYLFDQGSLASWSKVDATPTVRIVPYKHWNGKWAWWCVRSKHWAGKMPHFLIAKADHYNMVAGEWLACWARANDTNTWYQFDNVSIGAVDLEFFHNTAFPSGTIYVAALPMYPYSRVQRIIAEWAANSLVGETVSSTNNVIGTMTARDANDGSGRTAPGLPIYGLKVANATANTKNKAVLSSLQHPSETPGAYALEGAMAWLLGGSNEANFLLDWFEFFVYPCRSPQGVWAGFFRGQPQNPNNSGNWTTTGQWETVDLIKPAVIADIDSDADVCLDFHSYMAATDIGGVVVNGDIAGQYPIFATAMEALDADFELTQAAVGAEDGTFGKLLRDSYGVDLYVTLEQGGEVGRTISDWITYGENAMKALQKMQAQGNFANGPGVGSRNFNGTTDRIDWASIADTAGQPLTISAWINLDTLPAVGASEYIFANHRAGDAAFATVFGPFSNGGALTFFRNGTALLTRGTTTINVSTGVWAHVLVTHDGVMTTASSIRFYINGAETGYTSDANGAGEYAATGKWSLGGRITDDIRNIDGKIAQVGVWNRVLTPTEIANLAAGYAPSLIPSGLQFYFKGNTASLTATPGGDGTADGTTSVTGVGNGPSIIY